MQKYVDYPNREEWLKGRIHSIGASEVACVLGMGFQNPVDLWKTKVGLSKSKDLSDNKRVKYGNEAEQHLRALFALKNEDRYIVDYFPYRTYLSNNGYLSCTLDGELTKCIDGRKGVWECKTVFIQDKKSLEEWNGKIPNKYYIQVCQQLGITKYQFVVVTAELIFPDGNSEIRNYEISLNTQLENDIKYVETEAVKFWVSYVLKKKKPPVKMTL
jgi:putative phage-type endonuclease